MAFRIWDNNRKPHALSDRLWRQPVAEQPLHPLSASYAFHCFCGVVCGLPREFDNQSIALCVELSGHTFRTAYAKVTRGSADISSSAVLLHADACLGPKARELLYGEDEEITIDLSNDIFDDHTIFLWLALEGEEASNRPLAASVPAASSSRCTASSGARRGS